MKKKNHHCYVSACMLSPTAFRFFLPFRWGWNHIPHFTTTLLGAYWMRSTLSTRNFGGGRGTLSTRASEKLNFPTTWPQSLGFKRYVCVSMSDLTKCTSRFLAFCSGCKKIFFLPPVPHFGASSKLSDNP